MAGVPHNGAILDWLAELLQGSELGTRGVAELRRDRLLPLRSCRRASARRSVPGAVKLLHRPDLQIEFPGFGSSGGGGGRYDDLIGMFSGQTIPACGFSLGLSASS